MPAPDNVFTGLKVVEISSFIAASATGTILSDFGADVIKIEPPQGGDPYRAAAATQYTSAGINYAWQLNNRNKRSLGLDLKSKPAKDVLRRLVECADVLITNCPPKVKANLGLTYEILSAANPRLIYADVTGYGADGPEADKPGFDVVAYWGRSGLMDYTRDTNSPPAYSIPGLGDHTTATTLFSAIVTGLYLRERTGRGSHVTTSLLAAGVWSAADWVEGALYGAAPRPQSRKAPITPLWLPYRTSDDRWVLLALAQDKDWPILANTVGLSHLIEDARFATLRERVVNGGQLVEILDQVFAAQPLAHWRQVLDEARLTYGIVQTPADVVRDPQVIANEILLPLAEPLAGASHTVASPIQVAGFTKMPAGRAPDIGEHSVSVLAELGFSNEEIRTMESEKAIRDGQR